MKKITRNIYVALVLSSAVVLPSCKNELNVENLNNPDSKAVLSNLTSVASLPSGGYLNLYNAMDGFGLSTLDITGDYMSSSWGNFGMRDLGTAPRTAFNNSIAYSNAGGTNLDLWKNLNSALGTARDPLVVINIENKTLIDNQTTQMVKASCEFLQGVSMGYLSLFFDKAYILDENTPLSTAPLSPAADVRDAAVAKLEKCIATCNATAFTTKFFNGQSYSNVQLAKIASTMAARILAYHPRTPDNTAYDAVNWAKVKTFAENGIDFDFIVSANANNYVTNARWLFNAGASDDTAWSRIDQRIVSLISTNGLQQNATQPMIWPDAGLDALTGVTDKRLTKDWKFGDPPFIAGRGRYFFSNYYSNRYTSTVDADAGPCNLALKAENDLILAEALLKTGGSTTQIATLINNTRVTRGELPALTGAETNLLLHIMYERSIELINSMAGVGFLDNRRLGYIDTSNRTRVQSYFTAGTIPHYPVPAIELNVLKLPIYTFGGQ